MSSTKASEQSAASGPAAGSRYVLGVLFVVYLVNFVDRQILSILIEPIKADLALTDTQLGFLSGLAFAAFYVVMGIPIGRLADVASRRNIIAVCLSLWSVMTALAGFAQNFVQLMAARIGVGIGEAGCVAPAQSMIADYFPAEKRATALSIFSMGAYGGILVGFLLGGWVNEAFGWRVAFLVVGLPGIALAVLFALTVREPRRGRFDPASATCGGQVSVAAAASILRRKRTFWHIVVGGGLQSLVIYGALTWMPSFLIRTHGLGTGEVGTYLALIQGLLGGAGTLLGGYLADRLMTRDLRWYLWLPALSALLALPAGAGVYLSSSLTATLAFFAAAALLGGLFTAPIYTAVLGIVPARLRATTVAIFLFFGNLIGLGLGPLAVGTMSDVLAAALANDSLRYSLLSITLFNLWAAGHYMRASRHIDGEWASEVVRSQIKW